MHIIAHRGYWIDPIEKNTNEAFLRAFQHGFGVETDFRDCQGSLVVAHDLPVAIDSSVSNLIDAYRSHPVEAPIAINIKADGLHVLIKQMVQAASFQNCYVFDMASPDMRGYFSEDIPVYSRVSEFEPRAAFFEKSAGVWLDAFEGTWFDFAQIKFFLNSGKQITFVSPELHRREYHDYWAFIRKYDLHKNHNVSLCTDFPLEAKTYFT